MKKKNSIFFPSDHLIIIIISFVVHVYHSFIHTYMVTRIIWLFFSLLRKSCLRIVICKCCNYYVVWPNNIEKSARKKLIIFSITHTHACMHLLPKFFFFANEQKNKYKILRSNRIYYYYHLFFQKEKVENFFIYRIEK